MKTKSLFAILVALVCISCEPIDDNNVDIDPDLSRERLNKRGDRMGGVGI